MLNIVFINNFDMIELQKLVLVFEKVNFDIKLCWVIMEESVLCQCLIIDIVINSGQFDLMIIGVYEVLIWVKKGWLVLMSGLLVDYDEVDFIKLVWEGLSVDGKFYVLLFYVESLMIYYCKDLFEQKKLIMLQYLIWDEVVKLVV